MKTLISLLLCTLFCSCGVKSSLITRSQLTMGHVPLNILIKVKPGLEQQALEVTDSAYALEKKLEEKLSEYQASSDATCLNKNAGKNFCPISEATYSLLQRALELNKKTEGAFDIRFKSKIEAGRKGKVILETRRAKLENPETEIGLSSLLKGYILDQLMSYIKAQGFQEALLDAGGDVLASGGPWKVAIQIPGKAYGKNTKSFEIKDEALTTSSNHENAQNVIDPKKGQAVRESSSVSVRASSAELANSLSTSFYVMGEKESAKFVPKFSGIKMIWVDEKGSVRIYP